MCCGPAEYQQTVVTTWPCLTEAVYLLGKSLGHAGQNALLSWVVDGLLLIYALSAADIARMQTLMTKYADTPMDLADASLVVAAETLGTEQIFTRDSDFYVYRLANGSALLVIP